MKSFLLPAALALFNASAAAFNSNFQFRQVNASNTQAQESEPAFKGPEIDFCKKGSIYIFLGDCRISENGGIPEKNSPVSPGACLSLHNAAQANLKELFPYATVKTFRHADENFITDKLAKFNVIGFIFAGKGTPKGSFVMNEDGKTLVADPMLCRIPDFIGVYSSFSKYSPEYPAPANLMKPMLARMAVSTLPESTLPGTWMKTCKPKISAFYETRTLASQMKQDTDKFMTEIRRLRTNQVKESVKFLCQQCANLINAKNPLAKLCPPNSKLCAGAALDAASEKLLRQNYCSVVHPEYTERDKPSKDTETETPTQGATELTDTTGVNSRYSNLVIGEDE